MVPALARKAMAKDMACNERTYRSSAIQCVSFVVFCIGVQLYCQHRDGASLQGFPCSLTAKSCWPAPYKSAAAAGVRAASETPFQGLYPNGVPATILSLAFLTVFALVL
ncbi:Uncharacterized protein PBTT_08628 [Plasmodiophora brassicae]